jgi:hypothetical protein
MTLENADEDFELWRTAQEIHDTIRPGFHAGKGFYIHKDSVLQEDDIFRKRINDSTFVFVAILTFGNLKDSKFTSIYYDSVDERELRLTATQLDNLKKSRTYSFKFSTGNLAVAIGSSRHVWSRLRSPRDFQRYTTNRELTK